MLQLRLGFLRLRQHISCRSDQRHAIKQVCKIIKLQSNFKYQNYAAGPSLGFRTTWTDYIKYPTEKYIHRQLWHNMYLIRNLYVWTYIYKWNDKMIGICFKILQKEKENTPERKKVEKGNRWSKICKCWYLLNLCVWGLFHSLFCVCLKIFHN